VAGQAEEKERKVIVLRIPVALATGLIIGLGVPVVLAAVAVRDLVGAHSLAIASHVERINDFEARLRTQEQRPPRLGPGLDEVKDQCDSLGELVSTCRERVSVIDERTKYIQSEQETGRLCARVSACKGQR
jgi:hypothetical protein